LLVLEKVVIENMIDKRAVYMYKVTGEQDFGGLALNVHYENGFLIFNDTDRGHGFEGTLGHSTDKGGFTFLSVNCSPGEWVFEIFTIEDLNLRGPRLVEGYENLLFIKTTQDLHRWYRTEFLRE